MPRHRDPRYVEVGRRLRQSRIAAGYLSIRSLVSAVHGDYPALTAKQLGGWERGDRAPDPLALRHIAPRCGTTVDAVLGPLGETETRDNMLAEANHRLLHLEGALAEVAKMAPEEYRTAMGRIIAILEETVGISRVQAEANKAQAEANRDQALANKNTAITMEHYTAALERLSRHLPPCTPNPAE